MPRTVRAMRGVYQNALIRRTRRNPGGGLVMRVLLKFAGWVAALVLIALVASKFLWEPVYAVSSAVDIRVPSAKVWDKVGNLTEWMEWVKGLERLTVRNGDGRERGSLADVLVYN